MTIGLVTEPKSYTRKHFFCKILKLRLSEKVENTDNPFILYAEILPFSSRDFERLSPKRLKNIIYKKIRLFKKNGITKLILSDYIFKLCNAKGIDMSSFANGDGRGLFLSLLPLCLRQTAKKAGIDLFLANVCIRDSKLDRISEYLIRQLCFDTKKLYLCTQNLKPAHKFCESFCDETGLWIDVIDKIGFHCDVMLDVDNYRLRIGNDLSVCDARFGFNFCGYNVCHTDVAALLTQHSLQPTDWVYSYEK